MIKSCLKHNASKRPGCSRTVSFRGQDSDEIHPADEWDRSPIDAISKLTYECVFEISLNTIERD